MASSIPPVSGGTLLINSAYALNSSSTDTVSNFDLDFTTPAMQDSSADVCIRFVHIPFTMYNINSLNNLLSFDEADDSGFTTNKVTYNTTLVQSNYNGNQLASQVQTQMNAAGQANTYTVTYNSLTQFFTWTATGATKYFRLVFVGKSKAPLAQLGFTFTLTNGTQVKTNTAAGQGGGATLVSTVPAQLQPCNTLELRVAGFNEYISSNIKDKSKDVLISIPCLVPYGFIIEYEPSDSDEAYHIRDLFSVKRFRLTCDMDNCDGYQDAPIQSHWRAFLALRKYRSPIPERANIAPTSQIAYQPNVLPTANLQPGVNPKVTMPLISTQNRR